MLLLHLILGSKDYPQLQPEEEYIRAILKKNLSIVIFGTSSYAKATVVNELFGETVLPVPDITSSENSRKAINWRTLFIRHGVSIDMSLVQGDFEVVGHEQTSPKKSPVNGCSFTEEDLQQMLHRDRSDPRSDATYRTSVLQYTRPSHLRRCDVIVVQGLDTSESIEEVYRKCVSESGAMPVFIYATEKSHLSQTVTFSWPSNYHFVIA